jgi:(hydroxyamino)benzene mutase
MSRQKKGLLCAGMFLFLCGLLNGMAVPYFTNPRAGLSAHLAAVQSGMFLLIVGLLWNRLGFTRPWQWAGAWLATVYSIYAVWIALLLSAILGTSRSTPIAGAGYRGSALAELMVDAPLLTGAGAGVAAAALLLYGLLAYRGND